MLLQRIKDLIKSINFRLSDLFFIVGFIPLAVFLIFGQLFMQYPDPEAVELKLPAIISLFLVILISWSLYIYLEYKRGNRVNKFITIIFLFLAIIGVIGIVIQPHNFEMDMVDFNGETHHVSLLISTTHYIFFSFDIVSILLLIYIGLFILPKRFTNMGIIKLIGYALFVLCLVLIIYSYIVEKDQYVLFIRAVKELDGRTIKYVSMQSFIINPNAYGMTLMMGVMFCLIFHSQKPRWWYWLIAIFFYFNMLFSFCRVSIFISALLSLIYIYHYLISTINNKKTLKIILLAMLSSLIFIVLFIMGVCFLFKGKVLPNLYKILDLFNGQVSLSDRERIWTNTCQLLSSSLPISFFFGNGFGLMNEQLLQVNYADGFQNQYVFPTHNSYLGLFAEGGILYLFAYIALLIYVGYVFIKCYKKQASLTITLSFGTLAFSFYSLTETIHYLVYPFIFLLLVFYKVCYNKKQAN